MLAAILQQHGYRTGLFTSPHLCRVEERIQVDREPIAQADLTVLLEEIRDAVEGPRDQQALEPTFFEIATALGFLHFDGREVDVAVIEVGLGGRFDSTNVCRPVVTVITSISLDHTDVLGHRLASIAMEKAGIVKPGCPAVSGATVPEARMVIEAICRERNARLYQLEVDFRYRYVPGRVIPQPPGFVLHKPRVQVTTPHRTWPEMEVGLLGHHQADNAAVTVACVEQLCNLGLDLDDADVSAGLSLVQWPARMEVFGGQPLVVLDCAHNVASIQAFLDTLAASFPPSRRLLIFAGSTDKDLPAMLRLLAPHFAHVFLTRYRTNPRSAAPEQLAAMLATAGPTPFTLCPTAIDAWYKARTAAAPTDLVCVTGSVFLAGELRPVIAGS
jgi:dihydrofolate synthase/folylpolyglutamate synthase